MGKQQWVPPSSDTPVNQTAWTPPSTDEEVKKKVDGDSSGNSSDASSAQTSPSGTFTNPDQPSFSSLINPAAPIATPFVNEATKEELAPNKPAPATAPLSEDDKQTIADRLALSMENKKTQSLINTLTEKANQGDDNAYKVLQNVVNANNNYNNLTPVQREARRTSVYGGAANYNKSLVTGDNIDKASEQQTADLVQAEQGSWANAVNVTGEGIGKTVTSTISGLLNWSRNEAPKLMTPGGLPVAASPSLYNADGSESNYAKSISWSNDAIGKMILGLDGASDFFTKGEKQTPLPNTIPGHVATDLANVAPDIAATALAPEAEGASIAAETPNAIKTLGQYVWNPFTKWMVAKGALQGYSQASRSGANPEQAAESGIAGAEQGLIGGASAGVLGGVGGKLSESVMDGLISKGIVSGTGQLTSKAVGALSDATVFGTAPIITSAIPNAITGKPIDAEDLERQVESGIGTGLAFGIFKPVEGVRPNDISDPNIKAMMMARQADALHNFSVATPEAIVTAYDTPLSSGDMNARAIELTIEAQNETDPDKKQELITLAKTFAKASDVKATANAVINDKDGFVHSIAQSDIGPENQALLINKIDDINNTLNPHAIEQQANENAVHTLSNNIDALQANGSPDPVTDPEGVNNLIDAVQQRTDLQVKTLDKAGQPQPFISEPGEENNGEQKEIPQTGPAGTETETQGQESVSGNNGPTEGNAENSEVSLLPGANGENNQTEESATAGDDNNNESRPKATGEPFSFNSKEHGELKISPLDNGEFNVHFTDGTDLQLSSKEIKDHFNFDTDKIHAPENVQRLHSTDDPATIARMYDDKVKELQTAGDKESEIALYGPTTDAETFGRVNDPNNITNGIRLNYFRKGEHSNASLDTQADEINQNSFNGKEVVTPNDIAQFMIDHPGGAATHFTMAGNPELKEIANRYEELTGKQFSNRLAKSLATKFGNMGSGEIKAIQNEFEGDNNVSKVKRFIDNEFHNPGYVNLDDAIHSIKKELDSYIADPTNDWNFFHGVFSGETLTPEEIDDVKRTINEHKDEQLAGAENGTEPANKTEGGTPVEKEGGAQTSKSAAEYDATIEAKKEELKSAEKAVEKKLADLSKKNDLFEAEGIKKSDEPQGALFDTKTNTEPEHIAKVLEPLRATVETAKRDLENLQNNRNAVLEQANAQTELLEDDIPFQKGEGTSIPPERAAAIQGVMEKVFPNIETNFHSTVESFEQAAKSNDITVDQKDLPNAFVDRRGVLQFNPEQINADTQIHEYGHILTQWAKENAPKLYDRMIKFGAEAKNIHAELAKNGYNLSGSRLADEAFVTMLGRDGEGKLGDVIKNSGTRGTVSKLIHDAWSQFQRYVLEKTGYDISKFKNIKNMSINEFLDTVNKKYLLSESKISDAGTKEFSDINQQRTKPMRTPGETMADYARRLIDWEKEQRENESNLPLKNLKTGFAPVRESIREINRAFKEGYNTAKGETKAAFLEYDGYKSQVAREALERQRENSKEKFAEYDKYQKDKQQEQLKNLKDKYEGKLKAETDLRQEQTAKLRDGFKKIRTDIKDIIVKLNRSGAFGGIKFTDKQLLSFANQLNNVTTERGLDKFRDFVAKAVQNSDIIRDVNDSKAGIKDAKKLLKADYVPQNIKSVIKDLVKLNPYNVSDPKQLKAILDDINNGQRSKEFSDKTVAEIRNFIEDQRGIDIMNRVEKLHNDHSDIYNSEDHNTYKNTQISTLPDQRRIKDMSADIVFDPDTKHYEKVRKLNNLNDAVNMYGDELHDSIRLNPDGVPEADRPVQGFNSILDNIENKPVEISDTQRDHLEDLASARQASIDIHPEMSDEQRASLKILQDVPLAGQDANTLRLFNNVLDNVVNNDDHSGIGIFEAKAVGNSNEGALKLVNYLKSINTKVRDARLNKIGKLRTVGADVSVMLSRISNNDFKFLGALNTGTHFDEIKNGFTKSKQVYDDILSRKVEQIFKDNPTVAKSPESVQRLSLFSYLNQNREFSSPDEADAELQKRIGTIQKDIVLKSQEGLKDDNAEAEIENHIFNGIADKIKEATGVDVHNPDDLKNLGYDDFKKIEFLEPGERAVYDAYRAADDELRPQHEEVVNRQLNKTYEGWNNHMRDGYRLLGSGLTDVVTGDNLGFAVQNENTSNGSVASLERVKGDPLAQKDASNQRVLNLNFFDTQNQNIKDQLFDIHTLKNRQIFDEAMKNRELRDSLGAENHQLYKDTVKANVLNEMGLNQGMGSKELNLVNKGLNIIAKAGTARQLLSVLAHPKHYLSNLANTLGNLGSLDGPKLMWDAATVVKSPDVQALIKQHPISERAENLASLNTLSNDQIADKNNTVLADKGLHNVIMDHVNDFFNKYMLGINSDGTTREAIMAKPIKFGDVKSAEWSWVAYYAKHLMESGTAPDFKSIDWSKESETPNREAADYAETMTSKQMNENTRGGRSELIGSKNTFLVSVKYLLFPFGSRNMHNLQTMVEDFRTLAAKDTFVNSDYRSNQATNAAKSLVGLFAQEAIFQGVRIGGAYAFAAIAQKGLTYVLSSLFANDKEKQELMDRINSSLDKKQENMFQQWAGNTVAGYFFSGLGNAPEEGFKKGMNSLVNKDLFYEPKLSINQEIADANKGGMYGAATSGMNNQIKDIYRVFDNYDKYGVPVNITPYQKSVIAVSALSNFLAFAALNDANLNRSIEAMRTNVEYSLAKQFHDPNYEDISAPSPVKIGSKNVMLSSEHQDYYEQQKLPFQQALEKRGYDSKKAATLAAAHAKAELIRKYGYNGVINDGEVMKKKK